MKEGKSSQKALYTIVIMSTDKQSSGFGNYETPSDFSEFVEFTNRLHIPLNEDYISQLQAEQMKTGNINHHLSALEIGVKNSKFVPSEKQTERRLQNAIWRAWWRQRRARFNADPRVEEEDLLDTRSCLQNKRQIHGSQIGDIPTEYSVPVLKPYELPVVGTYVDKNIIPGFVYRVRLNGTDEHLFDGEALRLQSIGQGYGKRLTFECDDLLENPNFFWSDSNHEDGFGFTIKVISEASRFGVFDWQGRRVAKALVTAVDEAQEIEHSQTENGNVELRVRVTFECRLQFTGDEHVPECLRGNYIEVPVTGIVVSRKTPLSSKAKNIEVRQDVLIRGVGNCSMRFE